MATNNFLILKKQLSTKTFCLGLAIQLTLSYLLIAGETSAIGSRSNPTSPPRQQSAMDNLWGSASLYQNKDNSVLQKLALTGRLHADAVIVDSKDDYYEDVAWRRFRLGAKAQFFSDFTLHAEADLDLNTYDDDHLDDTYNRLTDAYLAWSQSKRLKIKLGKQSAPFTLDGATSSKKLLTPERSLVATNLWFPVEYFTGVSAAGQMDRWKYLSGIYSSSGDQEFGHFDSGYFGLFSIEYDLGRVGDLERAAIRLDYVYNDPDYSGDVGTRNLRHILTLASWWESTRAGLRTDVSFGSGLGDQSDLYGFQLMPYYNLNEMWQLVFRYSYVYSPDDQGVRLNRYESKIHSTHCNSAHELFFGINCYLYGHRLKWQNGIEYVDSNDRSNNGGDYRGWGLTSAFRMYF